MILIHAMVRSMFRRVALTHVVQTVLLAGTVALAGCAAAHGSADGRPIVAVSFFPLEDIVRAVGGDTVHVVTLVPPGQDAHEFEATPQQLTGLERADAVVYLGSGFQPSLEKEVDGLPRRVRRVDLLKGQRLLPVNGPLTGTEGSVDGEAVGDQLDPHVWLDPVRMATMADDVAAALRTLAPAAASHIDANLAGYRTRLDALHHDITVGLADCRSRVLVTSHRAFGYLAAEYGLTQVSIAGVSSSDEPSARTLRAVADFVRSHGVRTVFFQQSLPRDLAQTVAGEAGAHIAMLDSLEAPTHQQLAAHADYDSLMRANLSSLRHGLECA
jgi:zinc transport system substrate-binding protein